jgi:hypothetical protein
MSAKFLTPLRVERAAGSDSGWVLAAPLVYDSEVANRRITVPAGFATDFASVPRLPLAYWLFGAVADEAAVVHDYLYSTGACPRKLADDIFAEASAACGVAAWRRGPMWLGVRLFGGTHYVAT